MSGLETFFFSSHIHQGEPADLLPLQPFLLFGLLSRGLQGFAAELALSQTASEADARLLISYLKSER